MPLLKINTNVSVANASAVSNHASKLVADMLGKPESYVMVIINPDLSMLFGGTDEATAHLKLKSLGLPESETTRYSELLCGFVEQQLGVKPSRTYIEFAGPPRHLWGWDNRTF